MTSAITATNVRFVPTFLYDVDPTVGSTSVPGFTEWGGLYRFYRVNASKITASFANGQAFNTVCYICPVNTDPGANHSAALAQTYLSQKRSKKHICGPLTGNGQCTLSSRETTAGFGGSANNLSADNYTALVSGGTPTNNWYWDVGTVGTGNVTVGVDVEVSIDIEVEFSEVQAPSS